jgi:hypothetical protein
MGRKGSQMEVNCGSCKFLDVPPQDLTKAGTTKKVRDFHMYECVVPFAEPVAPKWYKLPDMKYQTRYMCPRYGDGCPMHEPRK